LRLKRGERLYHELITEVIVEGQRLGEIRPGDPYPGHQAGHGHGQLAAPLVHARGAIAAQELMSATVEYMLAELAVRQPSPRSTPRQ
jgi:hypothetical protein